jgi:hypothetical protein
MQVTIFSVPLQKLTAIDPELTATFIEQLIAQIPVLGKTAERYLILNNNIQIVNPNHLKHLTVFNAFLQYSTRKCAAVMLTKY